MAIGGAIASIFGLFGFLIGAFAGSLAGQSISPFANRRTRAWVYPLSLLSLFGGSLVGWSAVVVARISMAARPGLTIDYWLIPFALLQNWVFWVFAIIAIAVAYQRIR
jgi:hypothetical protein